jgi:hypothetical protein
MPDFLRNLAEEHQPLQEKDITEEHGPSQYLKTSTTSPSITSNRLSNHALQSTYLLYASSALLLTAPLPTFLGIPVLPLTILLKLFFGLSAVFLVLLVLLHRH